MSEFDELLDRIDAQRRRALAGPRVDVREVEDLLTEGYLAALTCESSSRRLSERLETLVQDLDEDDVAVEARRVARQKRTVDRRAEMLRRRLNELRAAISRGRLQPS